MKNIVNAGIKGSLIGLGCALVGAVIIMTWNKATKSENLVISPKITGTSNTNNFQQCDVVPDSVHDGDTIRVNCQGAQLKVRFACIDAPKLAQQMGTESRDYL